MAGKEQAADSLTERILATIGGHRMTSRQILATIGNGALRDITAKLTRLEDTGRIVRCGTVTGEDGRHLILWRQAPQTVEDRCVK